MPCIEIQSDAEFKDYLANNKDVLILVDFYAQWCGPCKMLGPKIVELSEKYTDVKFIKVDVDECGESAEECNISAMPTIQFYRNQEKVDEFVGANDKKIEEKIQELREK